MNLVIFVLVCLGMFISDTQAKTESQKVVQSNPHEILLMPGTARHVPWNLVEYKHTKKSNIPPSIRLKTHRIHDSREVTARRDDYLWNLQHVDDQAEYYLSSGAAEDTFAVVFTPADVCIVSEVYIQWFIPGTFRAFAADYSDSARSISPDGECSSIDSGAFLGTPIGAHRTPITPNAVDAYVSDWSYQVDIGGTFIVGDSSNLGTIPSFVIAVIKDDENPIPLADYTGDRGNLTYTWFGGPWTDGNWHNYSPLIDLMMLVRITYPFGRHAPIVNSMSVLSNTFSTTGPFTVVAELMGDGGILESDSITIHWTVNDSQTIGELEAFEVDQWGNGLYSYDISGNFAVGDEIEYWIISEGEVGYETIHLSFEIKEPTNPDSELLIIADQASNEQIIADLYRRAADDIGVEYEFWDTSIEMGIDASVINAGWSNIIAYGWTTEIVPVVEGENDPGFAQFLDGGGRLVLADQDLFFGHGLAADLEFAEGDFAYDYFGLESATNDPQNEIGISTADTVFYGVGGTAIDINFVNLPYSLNHSLYGTSNWADYLIPAGASPLFRGASDSMVYGVSYENELFKTAYLSFMPDAAVGISESNELTFEQFETLFEGVIDWLGLPSGVANKSNSPTEFRIAKCYPNPFNPSTTIEYDLPEQSEVSLIIYNIAGREVQTLISGSQSAGSHQVSWDGTKGDGQQVAGGMYFARLQAGEHSSVVKMAYLH